MANSVEFQRNKPLTFNINLLTLICAKRKREKRGGEKLL